jgi:hypothetical protein
MFAHPELLVSRIVFIGLIIEAFEIIRLRGSFADGGMFSRASLAILTGGTRWHVRVGASTGASTAVTAAMLCQAAAASVVVVDGTFTLAGAVAAVICLLTNGYLRLRRQIGGSGAEQLTFIVLVTFGLVLLAGGGADARRLGDGFIAAEILLAYFASGAAKLASPIWRNGGALAGVLSTEAYGIRPVANLLAAHPQFDRVLCWCVISWELTFPVILFVPGPVVLAFLLLGVMFHIACAVLMGLNRFVWAFCGCYPAVWSTAMWLNG